MQYTAQSPASVAALAGDPGGPALGGGQGHVVGPGGGDPRQQRVCLPARAPLPGGGPNLSQIKLVKEKLVPENWHFSQMVRKYLKYI